MSSGGSARQAPVAFLFLFVCHAMEVADAPPRALALLRYRMEKVLPEGPTMVGLMQFGSFKFSPSPRAADAFALHDAQLPYISPEVVPPNQHRSTAKQKP